MAFYDDCTQISPTIGDDGIRQHASVPAVIYRVFVIFFTKNFGCYFSSFAIFFTKNNTVGIFFT